MTTTVAPGSRLVLALDLQIIVQRSLEVIPGVLSWSTLLGLFTLAVVRPSTVAVFLILYDFYWLVRALHVGTHLVSSYRTLKRLQDVDWRSRLPLLDAPREAVPLVQTRVGQLRAARRAARGRRARMRARAHLGQEERFLNDLRALENSKLELRPSPEFGVSNLSWKDVLHVVILPTYQEPLSVLTQSLDALAATDYPKDRLWVVVALEERAGAQALEVRSALQERYAQTFGRFLTTVHPDGVLGERRVKSANATYAARVVQQELDAADTPYEHVLVSNFDADSVAAPAYFACLTYTFLTTADRLRCSYQPLPIYNNNIWAAPAFSRIVATNSTFWQIIQAGRPERLVTYSSHAMPFRALVDVGFWDPTVVSEDSRIFWQAYVHYEGRYRVVPLPTTVSMDAMTAPSLPRTIVNQYRQIRRWAWGIENFPFVARAFAHAHRIPLRKRVRRLFWMLEAWHSWSTAPFILAGLGWVAILFGGTEFQQTVLAFNLPRITRTLLTIGMAGLILNATLSLLLLPPLPHGVSRRRYVWMALQWIVAPVTASFLGALPALDAQTRLLFGHYLGFWVTPKVRTTPRREAPALTGIMTVRR